MSETTNGANGTDGTGGTPDHVRMFWNPVTATWEVTGLGSAAPTGVPGSSPARSVRVRAPRVLPGHGANTVPVLPGRTSRARARGRSGTRAQDQRTGEARAVSGLTRKQRREARAVAHRLTEDRRTVRLSREERSK